MVQLGGALSGKGAAMHPEHQPPAFGYASTRDQCDNLCGMLLRTRKTRGSERALVQNCTSFPAADRGSPSRVHCSPCLSPTSSWERPVLGAPRRTTAMAWESGPAPPAPGMRPSCWRVTAGQQWVSSLTTTIPR